MRRSFPLTLISLTLLVAACNWNPQKRQASITPSEPDEAVTETYAGRNVEVWENKKNTVYVDTETGTVLYQKNPKGESTTVKAFSTKVDVSDIASHLPKI